LKAIPPTGDGDFSVKYFEEVYNADLANGLGNLVARVAKLCERSNMTFVETPRRGVSTLKLLEEYKFNEVLEETWKKIGKIDKFIDKTKPWTLEGEELKKILQQPVEGIRGIAALLEPFLPETSQKIQKQFAGPEIKAREPLFPRIKND
jgi:methionyl-tRNA synthetase